MSQRIHYIGIRWEPSGPRAKSLEKLLDPIGDWVRFNEHTWFISTDSSSRQLYEVLRPLFSPQDESNRPLFSLDGSILVIALDSSDRFGWAPQWIWDWIDGQRQDPPKTAATILGARSVADARGTQGSSSVRETADG